MCHWHQSCRWTVEFQVIRTCLEKQISNICETGRWDHPAAEHSCIAHYSKLAMAAHQKYTKHSHQEHDTVPTFPYREHRSVPKTRLHFRSINIKITLKQHTTYCVPYSLIHRSGIFYDCDCVFVFRSLQRWLETSNSCINIISIILFFFHEFG